MSRLDQQPYRTLDRRKNPQWPSRNYTPCPGEDEKRGSEHVKSRGVGRHTWKIEKYLPYTMHRYHRLPVICSVAPMRRSISLPGSGSRKIFLKSVMYRRGLVGPTPKEVEKCLVSLAAVLPALS